jgi:DNA-binding GntR family transcriptional regulator
MVHREFHRAVYRASGNPILVDILEKLWDKADRYRLIGLRTGGDTADDNDRAASEHAAIYQASADSDPKAAAQAMRKHILHSLGRRAIEALEDRARQ